jgi:hypothetical protein
MDLSTDSMEGLDITSDCNIFTADSQRNILELKLKLLSKESEEKYDEVTFGSPYSHFDYRLHKFKLERLSHRRSFRSRHMFYSIRT